MMTGGKEEKKGKRKGQKRREGKAPSRTSFVVSAADREKGGEKLAGERGPGRFLILPGVAAYRKGGKRGKEER